MVKTIFSCDVCKQEMGRERLQVISIGKGGMPNSNSINPVICKSYDLCEACRAKLGIFSTEGDSPFDTVTKK